MSFPKECMLKTVKQCVWNEMNLGSNLCMECVMGKNSLNLISFTGSLKMKMLPPNRRRQD